LSLRGLLLLPLGLLYGLVTWFRNKLFDWKILPSKKFDFPVVAIGNLSMGGSGKTPFTEYVIRKLQQKHKLATLSRGYGRKTKGFLLADEHSTAFTIGDEPMQYFTKFKNIAVAVDEKRNRGIEKLKKEIPELDIVLLDDAYQHRYTQAGLNILITDFYKLYSDDYVFPAGRLREFRSGAKRADIVVVSKTPVVLSPITRRRIADDLKLKKNQLLLFSKIEYGELKPFFAAIQPLKKRYTQIVLFTGIANNYPLQDYLKQMCSELTVLSFPDHHIYKPKDIERITTTFRELFSQNKILVTTEKDAMRLHSCCEAIDMFSGIPFYYLPIQMVFHDRDNDRFLKAMNAFLMTYDAILKK